MTRDDRASEVVEARTEFQRIVDSFVRPPMDEVRKALDSASKNSEEEFEELREAVKRGLSHNASELKRLLGHPDAPGDDSLLAWLQGSSGELAGLLKVNQQDHDLLGALLVQTVLLGEAARGSLDELGDTVEARLRGIEGQVAATQQRLEAESLSVQRARGEDLASNRESAEALVASLDGAVAALSDQIARSNKRITTRLYVAITLSIVQAAVLVYLMLTVQL